MGELKPGEFPRGGHEPTFRMELTHHSMPSKGMDNKYTTLRRILRNEHSEELKLIESMGGYM